MADYFGSRILNSVVFNWFCLVCFPSELVARDDMVVVVSLSTS